MTPHEHLAIEIAAIATQRVVKRAVRSIQRLNDGLQSGDDSGLTKTWDEICAQVQSEHSAVWEAYEITSRDIVARELGRLSPPELCAIWLQTDAGEEWAREEGQEARPAYCVDDVVDYVVAELLDLAGRYSNRLGRGGGKGPSGPPAGCAG